MPSIHKHRDWSRKRSHYKTVDRQQKETSKRVISVPSTEYAKKKPFNNRNNNTELKKLKFRTIQQSTNPYPSVHKYKNLYRERGHRKTTNHR